MSELPALASGCLSTHDSSDDDQDPHLAAIRSQTSRLVAINAKKLQHNSSDTQRPRQQDEVSSKSDLVPEFLKSHKRPPEDRRARNRQSQSHYRQRQKKQHLEQQQSVKILTKDVERLNAEITDLKCINAHLGASLQGSGSLEPFASSSGMLRGAEMLTNKAVHLDNAKFLSSASLDAHTTVRDSPQSSAECPLDVPEALLVQRPWLQSADEDLIDSLSVMVSKARISCELPQLSQQELTATPAMRILENKEGVLQGVLQHLQRIQDGQGAHALQELEIMMAAKIRMHRVAMYNGFVKKDVSLNLATERAYHRAVLQHGNMPVHHWQTVAAMMDLAPAQQRLLTQMHEQLQQQLQMCKSEHSRLLTALQDHLPAEQDGDAFAARYLVGMDYSKQLQSNLKAEHEAISIFCLRVREEVLTAYQHAVMEVAAFPWRVDLPAICAAMDRNPTPLPLFSRVTCCSQPAGPVHPPPLHLSAFSWPISSPQDHLRPSALPVSPFMSDVFHLDELDIPADPFLIDVNGGIRH